MGKGGKILCPTCRYFLSPEKFHRRDRNDARGGRSWTCKGCCQEKHWLKRYSITRDQYEAMLEEQGNACALCRKEPKGSYNLAVDHDHKTGQVRGLLCAGCNRSLGYVEDPKWRKAAVAYLKEHRGKAV